MISLSLFCLSYFGLYASLFLLAMFLSAIIVVISASKHAKKVGLLSFLSPELQTTLKTISFFDIFVSVFIHRKLSKLIVAVIGSFVGNEQADEADAKLR